MNPFSYINNLTLYIEDFNKKNYNAGPIKFILNTESEYIFIQTNENWTDLLKLVIITTKEAWGYNDNDIISLTDTSVKIRLNYDILKKYLYNTILFI